MRVVSTELYWVAQAKQSKDVHSSFGVGREGNDSAKKGGTKRKAAGAALTTPSFQLGTGVFVLSNLIRTDGGGGGNGGSWNPAARPTQQSPSGERAMWGASPGRAGAAAVLAGVGLGGGMGVVQRSPAESPGKKLINSCANCSRYSLGTLSLTAGTWQQACVDLSKP